MTDRIVFTESLSVGDVPVAGAFVSHQAPQVVAIAAGGQGPAGTPGVPGIPGPAGGTTMEFTSTTPIGGHRVLSLNAANEVIYAGNDVAGTAHKIIGLSLNAASAGDPLNVMHSGEVEEPSWAWNVSLPVYLAQNGLLTQTPPASPALFSLIVGFPTATNKLFVSVREPILIV